MYEIQLVGLDIRQVEARGLATHADFVIENELPESFWTGMLPRLMDTSAAQRLYERLLAIREVMSESGSLYVHLASSNYSALPLPVAGEGFSAVLIAR